MPLGGHMTAAPAEATETPAGEPLSYSKGLHLPTMGITSEARANAAAHLSVRITISFVPSGSAASSVALASS